MTLAPTSAPAALRWQRFGKLALPEFGLDDADFVGFDGGYVLAGADTARFSLDGTTWESTSFEPSEPDTYVEIRNVASNGPQALLAGAHCRYEAQQDYVETFCRPQTFVSTDGLTWTRSEPFDTPADDDVAIRSAWPVPGGWEAITCGMERHIWSSADAVNWTEANPARGCAIPAVDETGTRLIVLGERTARLEASADGVDWTEIITPFTGRVPEWWVAPIVAPQPAAPTPWLFVVQDVEALNHPGQDPPLVSTYATTNLAEWTTAEVPRSFVSQVVATPFGFIADALFTCRSSGPENLPCPPEEQRQYLSTDGSIWVELSALSGNLRIANGPAGVVAVDIVDGRVWKLQEAETS